MGDERKVAKALVVQNTKGHFLRDHEIKKEVFKTLTIEEEYSKATSKKNYTVLFSLILFIVISLVSTYFTTEYMAEKESKVSINISSFRSLDLAELTQNIRSNKREIGNLEEQLTDRERNLNLEINRIVNEANNRIRGLDRNVLKVRYDSEVKKIVVDRDIRIAELRANYQQNMTIIKTRIVTVKEKINTQEENLATIRVENIRGSLENSQINTDDYKQIVENDTTLLIRENDEIRKTVEDLRDRASMSQALLEQSSNTILEQRNFSTTSDNEWNNRIQQTNIAWNNRLTKISNDFVRFTNSFANTNIIIQTNEIIRTEYITNTIETMIEPSNVSDANSRYYRGALEYLLAKKGDGAGYIISSDNETAKVFISSLYKVKKDDILLVFRDNRLVAEISIQEDIGFLKQAKIINKSSNNAKLSPFDVVVLSLGG